MIIDNLQTCQTYYSCHRLFERAFKYILQLISAPLEDGKYIESEDIFITVERCSGKSTSCATLEAHIQYIDIQMALEGEDLIGWSSYKDCHDVKTPYHREKDILFFNEKPQSWLSLKPGQFAIFFPHDAHAPLGCEGNVRKLVAKVKV